MITENKNAKMKKRRAREGKIRIRDLKKGEKESKESKVKKERD